MTNKKFDCMEHAARIMEILSTCGPTTATDLAPGFGVCAREMGFILYQLQTRKMVEKIGFVDVGNSHKAVLWRKYDESDPINRFARKTSSGQNIPIRRYRSPFAEFLGEPAIGFSAADQREGKSA